MGAQRATFIIDADRPHPPRDPRPRPDADDEVLKGARRAGRREPQKPRAAGARPAIVRLSAHAGIRRCHGVRLERCCSHVARARWPPSCSSPPPSRRSPVAVRTSGRASPGVLTARPDEPGPARRLRGQPEPRPARAHLRRHGEAATRPRARPPSGSARRSPSRSTACGCTGGDATATVVIHGGNHDGARGSAQPATASPAAGSCATSRCRCCARSSRPASAACSRSIRC